MTVPQHLATQIQSILRQQISSHKHCLLSTPKRRLHSLEIKDNQIVKCALMIKSEHKREEREQLEVLCFVSFIENNQYHTYYQLTSGVEKILQRRHLQQQQLQQSNGDSNLIIRELFVEFLCLYVKQYYEFDEIVQVVLNNTREMYEKNLQNQIQRKLTKIPPNAIMKDGRMYCQIYPEQFINIGMDEWLMEKVRKALKEKGIVISGDIQGSKKGEVTKKIQGGKSKITPTATTTTNKVVNTKQPLKPTKSKQNITQQTQPQLKQERAHDTKKSHTPTAQQPHSKKVSQKKSLPQRKLQIESQSEEYYHAGEQIPMFDLKQRITTDDRMELENQGNYLENQHQSANNNKSQKMQIESHQQYNNNHKNIKNNNKNKQQVQQQQKKQDDDGQDSMEMMMNQMRNNKKEDKNVVNNNKNINNNDKINNNNNNNNKPSIGAKSMPGLNKETVQNNSKSSKFTQPPSKSQPVRQQNLFGFFAKKV